MAVVATVETVGMVAPGHQEVRAVTVAERLEVAAKAAAMVAAMEVAAMAAVAMVAVAERAESVAAVVMAVRRVA